MIHKRTVTTFLTAFILALCVLGLGVACLLIECNIQQTVYGKVDPGLSFSLEEGAPVLTDTHTQQPVVLLTQRQQQGVAAALSPGYRLLCGLMRWETDAAARLWEWLATG